MDSYEVTVETFDRNASVYQDKYMYLDIYNDTYDLFCELIKKRNPAIFEMGCGPGNITKYLLSKRPDFKIEAIDMAPNMLRLAQINNPNVTFKVMDCRKIDKITAKYDAIIGGFCLPYLSKEDTDKLIKDCSTMLNPNGLLYLSTMEDDYSKSGYETASNGKDKAFIYYHQEAYLRGRLVEQGFEIVDFRRKNFVKGDGTSSLDIIFIAKKTG
jgi:trans-aconitate methyltransferase